MLQVTLMDTKRLMPLVGPLKKIPEEDRKIFSYISLIDYDPMKNFSNTKVQEKTGSVETAQCLQDVTDETENVQDRTNISISIDRHVSENTLKSENQKELFTVLPWNKQSKLHQQTYLMWKAPMDMSMRLRSIKKNKRIVIQPLEAFPDFVYKFKFKGEEISFFVFLQQFLAIFFAGFTVDLLPSLDMQAAGWNITDR